METSIARYSERGSPRGAEAILSYAKHASSGPHHSHRGHLWIGVFAAVFVVGLVAFIGLQRRTGQIEVVTQPTEGRSSPVLSSLRVPNGAVQLVKAAFGKVWVSTIDDSSEPLRSRLQSFDPTNGEIMTEDVVVGDIYQLEVTDRYLWIRTSTNGPASFPIDTGGLGDNAIYRVEPSSGKATPLRYFKGDGPLAARGTRIAAADHSHLEIFDDSGRLLTSVSTDDAVGIINATTPGTNGFIGLGFGGSSLFGLHHGRQELVKLDVNNGRPVVNYQLGQC